MTSVTIQDAATEFRGVVVEADGHQIVRCLGPDGGPFEIWRDDGSPCGFGCKGTVPLRTAMDHLCRRLRLPDWRPPPPPSASGRRRQTPKPNGDDPDARPVSKKRRHHEHHLDAEQVEEPVASGLVVDDLLDLLTMNLKPREPVLRPILHEGGLMMVAAYRGIGKTLVVHGMGLAVATGGSFLRWQADRPRKVLLIDGELPAKVLQDRARTAVCGLVGSPPERGFFRMVSMDRQALGTTLNLADPAHQRRVEAELDDAEVLFLDNIATLVISGASDNDVEAWTTMQAWLLQLRRRGLSVGIVHHAGRSGTPRGTSAREDVLDTVIELRRPEDYDETQGARFHVHLTKARGVFGPEAKPFEAKLETREGADFWSCADIRDLEFEKVRDLSRQGRTVRQIEAEAGVSKSTVSRIQARLRAEGDL